jgi:hypothetical protein
MLSLREAASLSADALSATRITAQWAGLSTFSCGVVQESWNGVKAAGSACLFLGIPGGGGGFGWIVQRAGDAAFGETVVGMAYARELGKGIRFGVRLDRYAIASPMGGRAVSWPSDLSLSWHAGRKIQVGLSLYDVLRVSFSGSRKMPLPRSAKVFVAVYMNTSWSLVAEWESTDHLPPSLAVSTSFRYGRSLLAQAGYMTATGMPYLGLGYERRRRMIMVGGSWQPALGFHSSLMLQWSLKKVERP